MQITITESELEDMKMVNALSMIQKLCDRWGFTFYIKGVGDGDRLYIFEKNANI